MQELLDSGMSFAEAFNQLIYDGLITVTDDYYDTTGNYDPTKNPNYKAGSSQQQEQSKSQSSQSEQTTPVKIYSHDFDTITDEARENFVYFSKDDVSDSMYLNIKADSLDNILTGKELNATNKNNETGKISFIEDGNTKLTWIIEAKTWESDDDYTLDLSAKMEDYDAGELTAYSLTVQDTTLPSGNSITLKVAVPYEDGTEVGLYLKDADDVYTKAQTVVSEDGFISITYDEALASYILSSDDLTTLNVVEEAEPEVEDVTEEVPEEIVEEPAPTEEEVVEVPDVAAEQPVEVATKKNIAIPVIAGICVVIALAIAGVVVYKRKKG